MRLCVVTFKECWPGADGVWLSYGGFPAQIAAVSSLFDDVTLVVTRGPERSGGLALPRRARVVPLRLPAGTDARRKMAVLAGLPYYVRCLLREIRRADVVHARLPGDIPLIGLVIAQLLGKRVFCLYGGSWAPNAQTTVMNRVTRAWMRITARGRWVMGAVGDGAQPPGRGIHWLFSTALARSELDAVRTELARGLSEPARLVYLGRLSPEKGVPVLLEALAVLRDRRGARAPRLVLLGDGPQRAELEQLVARLELRHLVRFAGQLARADLSRELTDAELCVHPSHTEGYCKAWLDAMAHGLPVVTTDVGAARAVVGAASERGWLVPPGRPVAFADVLERAIEEPRDWPAIRRRCRAFADDRTLEGWAQHVGALCANRWDARLEAGRLRV